MMPPKKEEPPKPTRPGVLVVDDMLENVELIQRALGGTFHVVGTTEVDEALALARENNDYVAIFCDQRMPSKSGASLLAELGLYAPFAERILISGLASYDDLVEAINVGGVDRFVEKPLSVKEIRAIADNAFRRFDERKKETDVQKSSTASVSPETFEVNLRSEIDLANQTGEQFSLLVLSVTGSGSLKELVVDAVGFLEGAAGNAGPRRTDVVSSLGNGEFAILLRRTPKDQALAVAMRISASLRNTLTRRMLNRRVSITIALAEFPRDGTTYETLMDAATHALDLARESGGDLTIACDQRSVQTTNRGSLRHWAKRAEAVEALIRSEGFTIFYQPIVTMATEEVMAYEALCRPTGEAFSGPSELFGVASGIGAVARLGQALRKQMGREVKDLPAGKSLFLNLHPDELLDAQFVASLEELSHLGTRLVLEITEVAELREVSRVAGILAELRTAGVRVAVDDFGAGHSGVSRILHLNPDYIKLDASLMRRIGKDPKTDRFVKFLLGFCTDEQIELVAEGVEDVQEKEALLQLGIRLGQGFLFAKPAKGFHAQLG